MILGHIAGRLAGLVPSDWQDTTDAWGDRVRVYRDYYDGNHRAVMTTEMRALLNLSRDSSVTDHLIANYAPMLVNKIRSRLKVDAIVPVVDEAPEIAGNVEGVGNQPEPEMDTRKEAQAWVDKLLAVNRFDALQKKVHRAMLRDGDTFVLVDWHPDKRRVRFTHELMYDGDVGCVPVYDSGDDLLAMVKIWREAGDEEYERRANIYYADRIEYYSLARRENPQPNGSTETTYELKEREKPAEWLAGVVPFVPFRNDVATSRDAGKSELHDAIGLQDGLNRTLASMVAAALLNGFQVRVAKGFKAPDEVFAGMVIEIAPDGLDATQIAEMTTLEAGELKPLIDGANWIIDQMATTSQIILPSMLGGTLSGEALKQRDSDMLAKVEDLETDTGNAWEDMITMAQTMQATYGTEAPPEIEMWDVRWKEAETRNKKEAVEIVRSAEGPLSSPNDEVVKETARILRIDPMTAIKERDKLRTAQPQLPGFGMDETGNNPAIPQENGNRPPAPAFVGPEQLGEIA